MPLMGGAFWVIKGGGNNLTKLMEGFIVLVIIRLFLIRKILDSLIELASFTNSVLTTVQSNLFVTVL